MKELLTLLNSIYPLSESATEYLNENLKEIEIRKKGIFTEAGPDLL